MGSTDVLNAALALPEEERAGVARGILESLGNDLVSADDDELLAEADRRESMMESDPAMEMSHEELMEAFARRRVQ